MLKVIHTYVRTKRTQNNSFHQRSTHTHKSKTHGAKILVILTALKAGFYVVIQIPIDCSVVIMLNRRKFHVKIERNVDFYDNFVVDFISVC